LVGRENKILCCISERTLLSPDYRGGEHFIKFYDHLVENVKKKGCECIYGITYAKNAFRKFGFETTQPIRHITLVFNLMGSFRNIFRTEEKWTNKLLRLALSVMAAMVTKIKYSLLSLKLQFLKSHYAMVTQIPSESDMKELLREFRRKYSGMFFLSFDDLFLNWRILNNPFRNYEFLSFYKKGILVAYAVIDVTDCNYELVDIVCKEQKYVDFVLWKIVSFCRCKKNCYALSFWGNYTNDVIKRIFLGLGRMGGVKFRSRAWFVLRILKDVTHHGLRNFENWYLTPIWLPTLDDR
jgi:hypothetical protein